MFLTWHLACHLQMSKQSPQNIPRIVKAMEQALLLYSMFIGTQIVWCWSDHIKDWDICNDPERILHKHSNITSIHPPGSLANEQKDTCRCACVLSVHTHTAKHVALLLLSEAASISVTQHAEVALGATCSLLQVLLAKVHTHQFISPHQFVRATHFSLLAEYFTSESLLSVVCIPVCFTYESIWMYSMCLPEYLYFIVCEFVCLCGCTLYICSLYPL